MERLAAKDVLHLARRIAELRNQIMDERFSLDHVQVLEAEIQEITSALTRYTNKRLAEVQVTDVGQGWLYKKN